MKQFPPKNIARITCPKCKEVIFPFKNLNTNNFIGYYSPIVKNLKNKFMFYGWIKHNCDENTKPKQARTRCQL